MISVVFLAINLILVPFAYLKTCWVKIQLARAEVIGAKEALTYILIGLLKGIAAQVPDLWAFIKTSWTMKESKRND